MLARKRMFTGRRSVGEGSIRATRKSAGTVAEVQCSSACKPLLGINIGDTEESVTNRLGAPTDAFLQGTTKAVLYQNLNLVVWLARERVNAIAMGHYENVREGRSR
jgi:hypothetical protein